MMAIHYMSVNGGVNNLAVATDTETGETSVSFIDKEHAIRSLKRRLRQRAKKKEAAK